MPIKVQNSFAPRTNYGYSLNNLVNAIYQGAPTPNEMAETEANIAYRGAQMDNLYAGADYDRARTNELTKRDATRTPENIANVAAYSSGRPVSDVNLVNEYLTGVNNPDAGQIMGRTSIGRPEVDEYEAITAALSALNMMPMATGDTNVNQLVQGITGLEGNARARGAYGDPEKTQSLAALTGAMAGDPTVNMAEGQLYDPYGDVNQQVGVTPLGQANITDKTQLSESEMKALILGEMNTLDQQKIYAPTESQVKGGYLENLLPDELAAAISGVSEVVGADGLPINLPTTQAIGMEPYTAPTARTGAPVKVVRGGVPTFESQGDAVGQEAYVTPPAESTKNQTILQPDKNDIELMAGSIQRIAGAELGNPEHDSQLMARATEYWQTPGSPAYGNHDKAVMMARNDIAPQGFETYDPSNWPFSTDKARVVGDPRTDLPAVTPLAPPAAPADFAPEPTSSPGSVSLEDWEFTKKKYNLTDEQMIRTFGSPIES